MNDREKYRGLFAAYFAGKLSVEDAAALESALSRDEKLARDAELLRPLAAALARASAEVATDFRLSADRLALIRATASGHIVEFPATPPAARASSRREVSLLRRLVPALAAAIAVVIGAAMGFSSGRERGDAGTASWRVTTQGSATEFRDTNESPFYAFAYGLEHYAARPAHHSAGADSATSEGAGYGIPGPRPEYLLRSSDFLLL